MTTRSLAGTAPSSASVSLEQASAQTAREDRTLHFLAEASHLYALVAPAASRSMVSQFRARAAATRVGLHANITQRFCERCSQVYVPGSNCRVDVTTAAQLRKKRRLRRVEGACARKKPARFGRAAMSVRGERDVVAGSGIGSSGIGRQDGARDGGRHGKGGDSLHGRGRGGSKSNPSKKLVLYRCCVCGHDQVQHRVARLPKEDSKRPSRARGFRAVALEEARNAAAAAKRAREARKLVQPMKESPASDARISQPSSDVATEASEKLAAVAPIHTGLQSPPATQVTVKRDGSCGGRTLDQVSAKQRRRQEEKKEHKP